METTNNARASKRKPAEDGDERAPTAPAHLDPKDNDDASRASKGSKTSGDSKRMCAVSVSSGSDNDAWKDPYLVCDEDKAFSDLAVFDDKKLDDTEYVKTVKDMALKYEIDFEQWKVGINVHKANCLDPSLAELREKLGIEIKLIAPKVVKEELPDDLDSTVFGDAELVGPVMPQLPGNATP